MRKRVTLGAEGAPSFWSAYFLVANVDAAQRFYGELLGWIFRDSANAPGVGRIARIDDPTGAGLYLIELAR